VAPGRCDQKAGDGPRPAPYSDPVAAEARAARALGGALDMSSFGKIECARQGRARLSCRSWRPTTSTGRSQHRLHPVPEPKGGIESDVTVTRVAENEFRIISGTSFVAGDLGWMRLHQPMTAQLKSRMSPTAWAAWGSGPKAREVLRR